MSCDYSENTLVQEKVDDLFRDKLGWELIFAYEIIGNLLTKLMNRGIEV